MRLWHEGVCDPRSPRERNPINNDHKHLPPVEYDKPFVGTLTESRTKTMQDLADWCAPHPHAERLFGCARRFQNSPTERVYCQIFTAPDEQLKNYAVTYEAVRRHEIGHCNGGRGATRARWRQGRLRYRSQLPVDQARGRLEGVQRLKDEREAFGPVVPVG